MKKIISWAKRPANMNLLAFIAIAVMLAFFTLDWYSKISIVSERMDELGEWLSKTQIDSVSTDDFENFAITFGMAGYTLGTKGEILLTIIMVYIPLILAIFTVIQAVFLRFIYKAGNNSRIFYYRIFMGISCFVTAALMTLYIIFILSQMTILIVTTTGFSIVTLLSLIICIINTYTKRIYDKEKLCTS